MMAAEDGGVRQRRRHLMMQQIHSQTLEDAAEKKEIRRRQKELWQDTQAKLGTALALFVLVVVFATIHLRRKHVHKIQLPTRNIITLLPRDIDMEKNLPSVVMGYAIVSPDNERERAAVKKAARYRSILSRTSPYRQTIHFHPIAFHTFEHQLITAQPGALDHFCGPGYQQLYQTTTMLADPVMRSLAEELVFSCMLQVGSADGYVDFQVEILQPMVRGIRGVAVQYQDEERIFSRLLFLPLLEKASNPQQPNSEPSTRVPGEMTKYLLADVEPGSTTEDDFRVGWEEFLYKIIQSEREAWDVWVAVCTESERDVHALSHRLMATWCDHAKVDANTEPPCCWIFDPKLAPPIARRREDIDD